MNEIADEIQRNCSATCSDVTLVLTELMDVIRDHLLNGEEVT
jgi:nucleoid DNA-binding protein